MLSSSKHRIIFFSSLLVLCGVLATLLPARADGSLLCVQAEKNGTVWRRIEAAPGSEVRLSFQHSLYGSRVEEFFNLRPEGFQLTELRYAEPRLVEFYGHESAKYDNGVWIVRPQPALFPSLTLHASFDASISLFFDHQTKLVQLAVPTDSAVRLTIADCKDARDG